MRIIEEDRGKKMKAAVALECWIPFGERLRFFYSLCDETKSWNMERKKESGVKIKDWEYNGEKQKCDPNIIFSEKKGV